MENKFTLSSPLKNSVWGRLEAEASPTQDCISSIDNLAIIRLTNTFPPV